MRAAYRILQSGAILSGLLLLGGCTTTAAKKAMAKPLPVDGYSGFDSEKIESKDRSAKKLEPVSSDLHPEEAVSIYMDHLTRISQHHYQIPAEGNLLSLATKQGVPEIIVRRIREKVLYKHEAIEVRAPALRLLITFGDVDTNGDLIEVLGDEEYGMRSAAIQALRARTGNDFGFNPAGGTLARANAIQTWRLWWQEQQQKRISGTVPVTNIERGKPPELVPPESGPSAPAFPQKPPESKRSGEQAASQRNAKTHEPDKDPEPAKGREPVKAKPEAVGTAVTDAQSPERNKGNVLPPPAEALDPVEKN